ncbi:hypothetical protein VTN96DRAFT_2769 [Rasamsonia emersonii]
MKREAPVGGERQYLPHPPNQVPAVELLGNAVNCLNVYTFIDVLKASRMIP